MSDPVSLYPNQRLTLTVFYFSHSDTCVMVSHCSLNLHSPNTFHFHALEKEMATHSSDLAWRIPGTGEPGGLPFMGSHRVRHD